MPQVFEPWESQRVPRVWTIGFVGGSMGIYGDLVFFWPLKKMRHCQDQMVSFGFWMAQRQPLLHRLSEMFKLRLVKSTWISWIINDKHRGLQVLPYARLFEDPSGLIPQDPSLSWLDAQVLLWSLNKVGKNCLGSCSQEYSMTIHA